jgi:hypothetical protein
VRAHELRLVRAGRALEDDETLHVPKFDTEVESQGTIKMTEPSDLDPRLRRTAGLQLGPRPFFHELHMDPGCPTDSGYCKQKGFLQRHSTPKHRI